MDTLHRHVADECRKLLLAGLPAGSRSRFVWSSLRICIALHNTYSAAAEIAQNISLFLEEDRVSESPALKEMGRLVNRLTRLSTVALFKEDLRLAKTVLKNDEVGRWFAMAVYHAHDDSSQRVGAETAFELAITKRFDQIAEQAYEVADAIAFRLDGKRCTSQIRKPVTSFLDESLLARRNEEAEANYLSRANACCWSGFWP